MMKTVTVNDQDLRQAASEGMDAFVACFVTAIQKAIGGELTPDTMSQLNADQITLLAWQTLHDEVMDGGFVQLIHNGYGPFIFFNPFAKALRLWGAHDMSKLIYKGRKFFEEHGEALTADLSDEEFMALFEQYPEGDDLDDAFIEMEEETTDLIAHYVDEHLEQFITVVE